MCVCTCVLTVPPPSILQFPRKCSVVTVVGEPVPLPKVESPTPEQVQQYLDLYIAALQKLFDAYQAKYAPGSAPLVII